jgi:hypothetical protein
MKKTEYMYVLCDRSNPDRELNAGDRVKATSVEDAYKVADSMRRKLNEQYGAKYEVQSVMPN